MYNHNHQHPYTFEKAREAVLTLQNLRGTLSDSELETLSLLLDGEALRIIEKSLEDASKKDYSSFEDAVKE